MTAQSAADQQPRGKKRLPTKKGPQSPNVTVLKRIRRRLPIWSMMSLGIIGLGVFFVYPLFANLYLSFTNYDLVTNPKWVGLKNYIFLFTQDGRAAHAARNTLWFVIFFTPIRIASALGIAMLLARRKRASGIWRTIFYFPALVPPVASVVAFVFLFNPGVGPVNTVLHKLGVHGPLWFNDPALAKPSLLLLGIWTMGEIMVIFLAALLDVPQDQYESSALDGAGKLRQFRYITVPNIVPVLLFAAVTGVILALQYFNEAAVASQVASGKTGIGAGPDKLIGYPNDSLLTFTQWLYIQGFSSFQLGYAAAMAMILFVATAIVMAVLLRRAGLFKAEG